MDVDVGGFLTQNTTYDYPDDYEFIEDFKSDSIGSGILSVFIPVLYSVVLVVGLAGNALLLFVLAKKRHHWRISDIFILNLSIADILLLVTLPFWAVQEARESGWCFGTTFCKICGAIFNINFCCGIFLLCFISLDRYLFIVHSVQLYSLNKPMVAWASCLSVWFISLLLTIPDLIFFVAWEDVIHTKTLCVPIYTTSEGKWQLWPRLRHHIMGLLLPSVLLIICWAGILLRLRCSTKGLQQQRTVTVLLLVVLFFLCWIPYNITLIVDTYWNRMKKNSSVERLKIPLKVTVALACLHSCLKPGIYLLFCGNFTRQTLALLRCETIDKAESKVKSSLWELGVGEEAPPIQGHELESLNMTECCQH